MSDGAPEAKKASGFSAKVAPQSDAAPQRMCKGMLHRPSGKEGFKTLAPKAGAGVSGAAAQRVDKPPPQRRPRMLHRSSGKAGFQDLSPSSTPKPAQQVPASDPVVFVEKKKD
eukprot:Rhum_TRINITY_DN14549_c11_g1::Rhum_TRINITY_DN14549_c11_g1_i1::g.98803::m.98803